MTTDFVGKYPTWVSGQSASFKIDTRVYYPEQTILYPFQKEKYFMSIFLDSIKEEVHTSLDQFCHEKNKFFAFSLTEIFIKSDEFVIVFN